jgi:Flp pilus assembly protein TadG
MRFDDGKDKSGCGGVLLRLARDKRANVMVIGAMAMFPLAGMVGGGLDLSRMYITKTRLQHACDAAVLAGRRTMGGGSWAFNNNAANAEAVRFFEGNWQAGSYGATNEVKSFTENNGVVRGTASVQLPMSLMRIFGQTTRTISVACDAQMRLLNTDVMFVLDTTGSMAQTIPGDTGTKMTALRSSVKCFYQILAQLDITDQDCEGAEPTGGVGPDVQLRFGFVPYSSNVNVGRLLPTAYMPDSWTYQSRTYQNARDDGDPIWTYEPRVIDISGLKNGATGWNDELTVPRIGDDAENRRIRWDGCIEERATVPRATYYPIPSEAKDLDIDSVPVAGDVTTQWKPVLPDVQYLRNIRSNLNQARFEPTPNTTRQYLNARNYSYACPTESRRLRSYAAADGGTANFMNYVNALNPVGGTYHDIGMIWGQRLLSPTGIFAADNRVSATGGAIERHLIFMTDGDTDTSEFNSGAYGIPWHDRRQFGAGTAPTKEMNDEQVDRRFEALCTRGRGPFTIWVIGFGALSTDTTNRLRNCASPGRFFAASNAAGLQRSFRDIAEQIGQLRLRN